MKNFSLSNNYISLCGSKITCLEQAMNVLIQWFRWLTHYFAFSNLCEHKVNISRPHAFPISSKQTAGIISGRFSCFFVVVVFCLLFFVFCFLFFFCFLFLFWSEFRKRIKFLLTSSRSLLHYRQSESKLLDRVE